MKAILTTAAASLLLLASATAPAATGPAPVSGVGPTLMAINTLTFGPAGTLYAADPDGAAIYAIEMGANKSTPGTKAVADIDTKIAATLGTTATAIAIKDLAVDPANGNSYISVMRGTGTDAKPAIIRVDGAGKIEVVATDAMKFTSITLPNAPDAGTRNRPNAVTDMAYQNGKLFVSGLSNEEFSSKLWSFSYPFKSSDRGTSVEIFHGNHGRLETAAPIWSFLPYTAGGTPYLIAGYLCTPLVRFPIGSLNAGAKVTGTTIAELGNRNQPIDMVLYQKDGKEFVLMTNTARGVMKIPTADFGTQAGITARVASETGGIAYEKITAWTGIEQLDKLSATNAVTIAKTATGKNLDVVALP